MFKDLSIPDSSKQTHKGTVADILKASQSPNSNIFNGFKFKNPCVSGIQRTSFASDAHALAAIFNQAEWLKRPVPFEHLHWGLADIKDSFHSWHIDSDGYGTFIDIMTGSKWWIVAHPKSNQKGNILNTISAFLEDDHVLDKVEVEAILLQPGSKL